MPGIDGFYYFLCDCLYPWWKWAVDTCDFIIIS